MSRSGYDEDDDNWSYVRWRGMVASASRGKRGQAFFRDLLTALDAMPEKILIADEIDVDGGLCALGVLGKARGVDVSKLDTENYPQLSREFNIAECLAQETMFINDESVFPRGKTIAEEEEEEAKRWKAVRAWCVGNLNGESDV